ncbi:MAG: mechanosensitive ion channel family protein [Planctomycetota bacterium]
MSDAQSEPPAHGPEDPLISVDAATETIRDTLDGIWRDFIGHVPLLAAGLVVLLATGLIALLARRLTRRVLRDRKLRRSLKDLFERVIAIGVWSLGLLLAAMVVFPGVSPADALAALGIGSIAIGLAFKDIFENFFAGILILWRFPFETDDFIECDGIMGRVQDVTIRNTLIQTVDGRLIVVPNAVIYKTPVEILTSGVERRVMVICGVAYGEDVAGARAVIIDAVRSCASVSTRQPVEVFAREFADSSVNFEIAWWTGAKPLDQRASRDEVVEAIKSALDAAGIEIPFPYRTLTFKEPLRIETRDDDERAANE